MLVYNMDVAGLVRRIRRFRFETCKAVSSNLAAVSGSDFERAKSYLAAVTSYIDWIVSQPYLDLPEFAPKAMELGEPEKLPAAENESIVDLMVMYDALEVEIANSQSARQATGLISHDEKRIRNVIAKMNAFLDTYVSQVLPLDLPESSPYLPMTGEGRKGV